MKEKDIKQTQEKNEELGNGEGKIAALLEKLQSVQKIIAEKRSAISGLDILSADIRKSFDEAIESILDRASILRRVKLEKPSLKKWKIGIWDTLFPINFKFLISMPFIYGMIFPAIIFHVFLEIYHQVCFRLYSIPRVNRKEYFIYDRRLVPYLNWIEKINCIYCSYTNNLIRYAGEISGRTERFWCPIKHANRIKNHHSQYPLFVDYLDAENFRDKWEKLRDFSDLEQEDKKSSVNSAEAKQDGELPAGETETPLEKK